MITVAGAVEKRLTQDEKFLASITVVGAGYVGLVTAACFASLGHNVRCVEQDATRLARIKEGVLPIKEPGLGELVGAQWALGGAGVLVFVTGGMLMRFSSRMRAESESTQAA